jgi:hypothetical protein
MSDDLVLAAMARRSRRHHRRQAAAILVILLIFAGVSVGLLALTLDVMALALLVIPYVLGRWLVRGLVCTPGPKHRWEVHANAAGVTLVAYAASVYLPLERVVRARWIFDRDLEDSEGFEGVLHLELDTGFAVSVHENASGCRTLIDVLDARGVLARVDVGS